MDYFKQRRAYRDLKMYEIDISAGQNNLYRELLDYANDKGYSDDWFPLKNDALLSLTGLSDSGVRTARNQLFQMGLVEYEKGVKNQKAPMYKLVKLYDRQKPIVAKKVNSNVKSNADSKVKNNSNVTGLPNESEDSTPERATLETQKETLPETQKGTLVFTSTDSNLTSTTTTTSSPSSVYTSQNNGPEEPHPLAFYQRVFNRPATAIQTPIIMDYADELGSSMVNHALMLAGEAGASFNYAKGIMDNWIKDGIKTVDQAKQASAAFKSKKKSGSYSGRTQVTETLPDWATNTNQKPKESAKLTPEQEASIAARLAKLEASKKEASHE